MIIHNKVNKIYGLEFNYGRYGDQPDIDRIKRVCKISSMENMRTFDNITNCSIFLGDADALSDIISSKLYVDDINNIHNIIIDKTVTFQRSKLSIVDDLRITRKVDIADCAVCNKDTFSTYRGYPSYRKVTILYSSKLDSYIVSIFNRQQLEVKEKAFFENYILSNSNDGNFNHRLIYVLKNNNIIDPSYEIIYIGDVVILSSKEADSIYNIVTKYHSIIFIDDLYKLINKNFSPLNEEAFNTLEAMMKSDDYANREFAVKALSSYNLEYCCTMTFLLIRNWRYIEHTKSVHSVAFKSILKNLNIHPKFSYKATMYINSMYDKSNNEEDKAFVRSMIYKNIKDRIQDSIDSHIENYTNLGFKINFTIE